MSFAYEERAVAAVAALLADGTYGIAAQLRVIETAHSLDPHTLPDPEAVIDYLAPADSRSPLVQVYDVAQENTGEQWRNAISGVEVEVAITYNSDSDISAAELVMRRFIQAVRMALHASPNCLGAVGQAWPTDANRTVEMTYDSTTRHGRAIGVVVRVQDP